MIWDCWGLSDSDHGRFSQRGPAGGAPSQKDPHFLKPCGSRHSVDGTQFDHTLQQQISTYQGVRNNQQQQQQQQRRPQQQQQNDSDPAFIMDSIRDELLRKNKMGNDSHVKSGTNVSGLINFVTSLRSSASNNRINRNSFHRVIQQTGGNSGALTTSSIDSLFYAFQQKDRVSGRLSNVSYASQQTGGNVSIDLIIDALCGRLSTTRVDLVGQAFVSLDSEGTGRVHIRDIVKRCKY
jgi:predicted RNA-binding protein with RPS1 domain